MRDYLGAKCKNLDTLKEKYKNGKGGTRAWKLLNEAQNDYLILLHVVLNLCQCPEDAYISLPNLAVLFGMEPSALMDIYMQNEDSLRFRYAGRLYGKEVRHSNWKYILIKRDVLDREGYEKDSKTDYLEIVEARDALVPKDQMVYLTKNGIFKMAYLVPQIGVAKNLVDGLESAKEEIAK